MLLDCYVVLMYFHSLKAYCVVSGHIAQRPVKDKRMLWFGLLFVGKARRLVVQAAKAEKGKGVILVGAHHLACGRQLDILSFKAHHGLEAHVRPSDAVLNIIGVC